MTTTGIVIGGIIITIGLMIFFRTIWHDFFEALIYNGIFVVIMIVVCAFLNWKYVPDTSKTETTATSTTTVAVTSNQ